MGQTVLKKKELYNSNILRTYIELIKSNYDSVDINDLLDHAQIDYSDVEDTNKWFTQSQMNDFHEKLQALTNNEDIAREAGAFTTAPETLGILRTALLKLLNPARAYEKVGELAKKISRSSVYQSKKISSNKVEITVTPNPGTKEEPFQCRNRIGTFQGLFKLFQLNPPKIEHPECMFKNGNVCRYVISWDKSHSDICNKATKIGGGLFLLGGIGLFFPSVAWNTILLYSLLSVSLIGFLSWMEKYFQIKEALKYLDVNIKSYDELSEKIKVNYDKSLMVKEVGEALSRKIKLDELYTEIIHILEKRLDYDRGLIMLANENKTRLEYVKGFGYDDLGKKIWGQKNFFCIDKNESKGPFVIAFKKKQSKVIQDINKIKGNLSPESLKIVQALRVQSLAYCPIVFNNKSLGILAVEKMKLKQASVRIEASDLNLLDGVASQIGIAINYIKTIAAQHSISIQHAKEKVLIELKTKEDLVARAVHNIRTPAYAAKTFLTVLNRDYKNMTKSEFDETTNDLETQISRIQELADDFMDFLKPLEVRLELINLGNLILKVAQRFDVPESKTKIETEFDSKTSEIKVDPKGLSWVFEEMLTNATKFNTKLVKITTQALNNSLAITIQDNGDGMDKKIIGNIFKPVSSVSKLGTGLGLPNAKKIIEEHGGTIEYDDSYKTGARFVIKLPLKIPEN